MEGDGEEARHKAWRRIAWSTYLGAQKHGLDAFQSIAFEGEKIQGSP